MAKEISGRGPKKSRSREKGNQGVGDSRSITFNIFVLFFILITFLYHFFLYIFHPRHLPRPSTTTHDLYLPPTISDTRFRVRTKPQTAKVNLRPIHTRGFAPGACSRGTLREQSSSVCTNDFMGILHPREQNFHPAKCSTILNRLNIWEQATGAN